MLCQMPDVSSHKLLWPDGQSGCIGGDYHRILLEFAGSKKKNIYQMNYKGMNADSNRTEITLKSILPGA
jgi:hypothetical protein